MERIRRARPSRNTQTKFFATGCKSMQHYVIKLYNNMQHYIIRGVISPHIRLLIVMNYRFAAITVHNLIDILCCLIVYNMRR